MKQVDHNGGGNNIRFGDSFTDDQFADETFDYFLTNPPFGVDWKKQQKDIVREHEKLAFAGRFGAAAGQRRVLALSTTHGRQIRARTTG
jgi:type I restriction enzyme M protein